MKLLMENWRKYVAEGSFSAGTSGELAAPAGVEQELLDYLKDTPEGIDVAMMSYAFGGSSQKWTGVLQGMVDQGKLEKHGKMYRLPA